MSVRRPKSRFVCQNCGYATPKWLGRCPDCGEWDSLVEEQLATGSAPVPAAAWVEGEGAPVPLASVAAGSVPRLATGIVNLDHLLGGGLVAGSLVLIGGRPGAGKSTLLLQAMASLSVRGLSSFYLSAEESAGQVALRAERLGIDRSGIVVAAGAALDRALEHAARAKPSLLVVDSIQAVSSGAVPAPPGTVSQVRECARGLLRFAKATGVPVLLSGHITREGSIAGPMLLEHMVDAVLAFDEEAASVYRMLRSTKNRFGPTDDLAVFEMGGRGLEPVLNPSGVFLAQRNAGAPGTAVTPCMEGVRVILTEVQALVSRTPFAMARRTVQGVERTRVDLIAAVLGRSVRLDLGKDDLFVNVAGGFRIREPAVDLALAAAIASSALGRPLDGRLALFGEVGLTGEVRRVPGVETRLREAARLGFARCLLPPFDPAGVQAPPGIEPVACATLDELIARELSG